MLVSHYLVWPLSFRELNNQKPDEYSISQIRELISKENNNVMTKEIWVSTIFGDLFSFSWNLNFHRNSIDLEFENLKQIMTSFMFTWSILDTKARYLSSSSLSLAKSFFIVFFNI